MTEQQYTNAFHLVQSIKDQKRNLDNILGAINRIKSTDKLTEWADIETGHFSFRIHPVTVKAMLDLIYEMEVTRLKETENKFYNL